MNSDCPTWLFRGVPFESWEVEDVAATGEITPPRPDRRGEDCRYEHVNGGWTDTAYTSWSIERSTAMAAAESKIDRSRLSGRVVVFRVRFSSISEDRLYRGRDDEDEYLIEGTVESVEISSDEVDDYEC